MVPYGFMVAPRRILYGLGSGEEQDAANHAAVAFGTFAGQDEYAEQLLGEDHYATQFFNALNSDAVRIKCICPWMLSAAATNALTKSSCFVKVTRGNPRALSSFSFSLPTTDRGGDRGGWRRSRRSKERARPSRCLRLWPVKSRMHVAVLAVGCDCLSCLRMWEFSPGVEQASRSLKRAWRTRRVCQPCACVDESTSCNCREMQRQISAPTPASLLPITTAVKYAA